MGKRDDYDWLKVRRRLVNHPKVIGIAARISAEPLHVVGALVATWALFDEQAEDWRLEGYSAAALNTVVRLPGFAEAMAACGWLTIAAEPAALSLPSPETHNTTEAKKRALDRDRKRVGRAAVDVDVPAAPVARPQPASGGGEPERQADVISLGAATAAASRLRAIGMHVNASMPAIARLVNAGVTPEDMALTAAEIAIRDGSSKHPTWPSVSIEQFAQGATAAQLRISDKIYIELRSYLPKLNYLAATIIGRINDAKAAMEADAAAASSGNAGTGIAVARNTRAQGSQSSKGIQSMEALDELGAQLNVRRRESQS